MEAQALTWHRNAAGAEAEENRRTVRELEGLIRSGEAEAVLRAVDGWPEGDIIEAMVWMSTKNAQKFFGILPEATGLPVLAELDHDLRGVLLADETQAKFRKMLARMSRDQALRALDELPDELAGTLVAEREDADELRAVLKARDDSAAAHMRHGVLTVPLAWTVGDVVEDIRRRSDELDRIDTIFVVDSQRRPVGHLRLRDLVLNHRATPLSALHLPPPVTIDAEADREDALALAEAEHQRALAVIDAEGRLIGGITGRELNLIRRDEAEENMLRLAGVSPQTTQFDSPAQIVRRRLPWLLGGLVGSGIAAVVIGSFEATLAEAAILASFIPLMMATAGNVGIQASTVSVQLLTGGPVWRGDFWARLAREAAGAAINGFCVGLAIAALVLLAGALGLVDRAGALAATALLSLTLVTFLAGTVGSSIPVVLRALGLDPAVATGIFITSTNDVFGVLVFFVVAGALYL